MNIWKRELVVMLFLSVLQVKSWGQKEAVGKLVESTPAQYQRGKLIFQDDFDGSMVQWVAEFQPSPTSSVAIRNHKLVLDVQGGVTVWLNKRLSGNLLIEYQRKVIVDQGPNDRLSDLNQFWMATDPKNKSLFTRNGVFAQYDSLLLYYVGFGGNTNSTTRFRKYNGQGERVLLTDLTDKPHLLQANKAYTITITVYNGLTKFFVDGEEYFSYQDPAPLREGYFGFRSTKSRQEIGNFKVYRLK